MGFALSRQQLTTIANAYGLGGEYSHYKLQDRFGPLVICKYDSSGFLTKMEGDSVRRGGSIIGPCDGKNITWLTGWEKCIFEPKSNAPSKIPAALQKPGFYCQLFAAHEATFAATETPGHVPERVFLFVNEPDFMVEYVADFLADYRRRRPADIFPLGMRNKQRSK